MRVKDALSKANITTVEGMEKKKTIAQILDEALEQEFPEEKVENIGKNYNETAKQEDVSYSFLLYVPFCASKLLACLCILVGDDCMLFSGLAAQLSS